MRRASAGKIWQNTLVWACKPCAGRAAKRACCFARNQDLAFPSPGRGRRSLPDSNKRSPLGRTMGGSVHPPSAVSVRNRRFYLRRFFFRPALIAGICGARSVRPAAALAFCAGSQVPSAFPRRIRTPCFTHPSDTPAFGGEWYPSETHQFGDSAGTLRPHPRRHRLPPASAATAVPDNSGRSPSFFSSCSFPPIINTCVHCFPFGTCIA